MSTQDWTCEHGVVRAEGCTEYGCGGGTPLRITRDVLREWAEQHRRDAARLREKATRLIHEAEQMERKAAMCERDAEEMGR